MPTKKFLLLFSLLSFATSSPAWAVMPELHGYMRAGTGTNGKGAKMECIDNQGIPSNPMRLGNECTIYGETALTAPLLKGSTDADPFFLSSVRLAYAPPGNQDFEGGGLEGQHDVNVVEAFVEGGKFEGSPLTYWAGKRFYRDVDVYIDDWYYWGEMSGNGGGVGSIPVLGGTFSVAALLQTGSTLTNVGMNQVQVLDFRLMQVPISDTQQLNFWGALGHAPAGDAQGNQYVARGGWLFGARWRTNIWEGFNDVSITHGERLLESLSLYGNAAIVENGASTPGKAERWRVVENLNVQPSGHFGLHSAVAFEIWDPHVAGTDQSGHFLSVAARPIWYLSQHYQIDFEAGHTLIQRKNDKADDGSSIGTRHLTRFTIAPSVALDSKLWARPVIRIFYSYSFWNKANMGSQYVGKDAPSLAAATAGNNIGIQTEVWF